MAQIILIAGGIGSGKSIVSQICRAKGYSVYDCDSRARILMNSDSQFQERLQVITTEEVIDERGEIVSKILAKYIFNDYDVRKEVNERVHRMVREDIRRFADSEKGDRPIFVESAIAAESGLCEMASECWLVEAPEELRIQRVMLRNNFSRSEVVARINAQSEEKQKLLNSDLKIRIIRNDESESLLLQVDKYLQAMNERRKD